MGWIPRNALLLCLLFAQGVSAAAPDQTESLDEVVVEASRTKLSEMRNEMVRLEDRFFERYNELNTNNDFDVHCAQEARVGTLLKRRYCRAVYHDKALEKEAQEYLSMLQAAANTGSPPGPPDPVIIAIEARRQEYQKNMVKVASSDPELAELLRERYEVGKRYEATRRKVFGRTLRAEQAEAEPAATPLP